VALNLGKKLNKMAKVISLKKMWHYCNEAVKHDLNDINKNNLAINAYKLLLNNDDPNVTTIYDKFSSSLSIDHIENLCTHIESLLELPVKDSDFLIETNDRNESLSQKSTLIFYLHNIRSGFNIGSMIRLADGFNIQSVVLSGYTAGTSNPQVKRASLGAEKNIEVLNDDEDFNILNKYINNGYQVIGLETANPNEAVDQFCFSPNSIVIVGNEKNGLPKEVLELCDKIIRIPMHGIKNSLNVVSALSITTYEWNKQCR